MNVISLNPMKAGSALNLLRV